MKINSKTNRLELAALITEELNKNEMNEIKKWSKEEKSEEKFDIFLNLLKTKTKSKI